jgi:hypothetical protein
MPLKWIVDRKNLGDIIAKQSYHVSFHHTPNANIMDMKIKTSCGCLGARWNKVDTVMLDYVPHKVPKHLTDKGQIYYKVTKLVYVTVIYPTHEEEKTLTFEAIVHKQ